MRLFVFLPRLVAGALFSAAAANAAGQTAQPEGGVPAKVTVSAPIAMEMEAAALEKELTNQIQAVAQADEGASDEDGAKYPLAALGLAVVGVFAIRKLAPVIGEWLNRYYDPWKSAAPCSNAAEEHSFSQFVASFTAGPSRSLSEPDAGSREMDALTGEAALQSAIDPVGEFVSSAAHDLAILRTLFSEIGRAPDDKAREKTLSELLVHMRSLKGKAGLPSVLPAWQMSSALEGLLKQIADKPAYTSPSTLRTLASGIDLLHALCTKGIRRDLASEPPVRLLAVDDDPISRHALSFALKKVFSQPDLAADGEAALILAEESAYDVIFLDVQMPRMDGFELCSRVHGTRHNHTTPVVFVTCQSDFGSRAKSTLTGGQDLIGKPFLSFELTVKALTLVLRHRLQAPAAVAAARHGRNKGTAGAAKSTEKVPELAPVVVGK